MAWVAHGVGAQAIDRPERQVGHADSCSQVLHVPRQHRPEGQDGPGPGAPGETHQALGQVRSSRPPDDDRHNGVVGQPAHREQQSAQRVEIGPVHVVDDEHGRAGPVESGQRLHQASTHLDRFLLQQRRGGVHRRAVPADPDEPEEPTDHGERRAASGLPTARPEHPEITVPFDEPAQKGRLPDACRPLDEYDAGALQHDLAEHSVQGVELVLPPGEQRSVSVHRRERHRGALGL
jgi:hypothetical protein